MNSKGRSASGGDGGAPVDADSVDAPDRLVALELQLLRRIDRSDRLSDDLLASQSELARKETLLVVASQRADSAEREQAQSAGRVAAMLDEVTRRRDEAATMARDLASTADRIARAEREAEARTRQAELIAADAGDLKRQIASKDAQLTEALGQLARTRSLAAREAISPTPTPATPGPTTRTLRQRMGPFAILAAPLVLLRKRRKPVKVRTLPQPSGEQAAIDMIAASDLFDAAWYLNKYPDIREAGIDPAHHYFHHGGAERRKPGPRFDPRWYAQRAQGMTGNPLIHYLTQGRAQGIEIPEQDATPLHDHPQVLEIVSSPLFDADWYRTKAPGLPKGREHAAHHYLTSGWRNGLQPGPSFDGDAYLKRYEDVREAGVNPLLHYLRHGRGERRQAFPVEGSGALAASRSVSSRARGGTETIFNATGSSSPLPADDATDPWIWTKAEDFADPVEGQSDVRLGDVLIGRSVSSDGGLDATLATFARLSGLCAFAEPSPDPRFATGTSPLVRDAWFLTGLDLRVRLDVPGDVPCAVRAYQVALNGGGVRRLVEAACDPANLSVVDLTLLNPFSSILLCVDDGHGLLSDASVFAFPSLARGGMHHGELLAADAHDSLSRHDATLAAQWLDSHAGPLSIAAVEVVMDAVIGGEAIFGQSLQTWLGAAMRMAVTPRLRHPTSDAGPTVGPDPSWSTSDLVAFGPERRSAEGGATLVIPGDGVPTLAALVSRSLQPGSDGPGPVILADTIRFRPRWHVTPPVGTDILADLQPSATGNPWPVLRAMRVKTKGTGARQALPPLALRFRENPDALSDRGNVFPFAPDMPGQLLVRPSSAHVASLGIVVSLDVATSLDELAATLGSIAAQTHSGHPQVVVVSACDHPEALAVVRQQFADGRLIVDAASRAARLNAGVLATEADILVFVEAGMVLHDTRTLQTLATIAGSPGIASSGCATIQPAGPGDFGRKLSLHGAGVFPDQISLRAGAQLLLGEPTTAAAMAPATYAVAANRFRLAVVPRTAWDKLQGVDAAAFPEADYDLDFGLRALKAGMTNVCTSVVSATRLGGRPLGRPGALSRASLSIDEWGAALAKMTILRTLD